MVSLQVLPGWFPSDLAFIALAVLIVAVLTLNKGKWWFVNVLATDEPIVVAAGVTIAVGREWLAANAGGRPSTWIVLGVALAAFGLYAVRSERVDLDFVG